MGRVLHSDIIPGSTTAGPYSSNADTWLDTLHVDSDVCREDKARALRSPVALVLPPDEELLETEKA